MLSIVIGNYFFSFHEMPRFRDWPKICWHPLIFKDYSTTPYLLQCEKNIFSVQSNTVTNFWSNQKIQHLLFDFWNFYYKLNPQTIFHHLPAHQQNLSLLSQWVHPFLLHWLLDIVSNKKYNGLHMYKDCYFIQISSKSEVIWLICTSFI